METIPCPAFHCGSEKEVSTSVKGPCSKEMVLGLLDIQDFTLVTVSWCKVLVMVENCK